MSRCYLSLPGCIDPADYERHDTIADAVRSFGAWCEEADRFGQSTEDRAALVYLLDERVTDEPRCGDYAEWRLTVGPRGGIRREHC